MFLAGGEKDGRYKGTFQGRQHEPTGASRSILHFTCTFFLKVGPAQMAQLNQQMSKMIDPGVLKQMGGVFKQDSTLNKGLMNKIFKGVLFQV